MRLLKFLSIFSLLIIFTFGCGHSQPNKNNSSSFNDESTIEQSLPADIENNTEVRDSQNLSSNYADYDQKIVYTANLQIQVKKYSDSEQELIRLATQYSGYLVETSAYRDYDNQYQGNLIFRVPTDYFEKFINDVEQHAIKVMERNVTGEDVTDEFIDLEARLASKRAVEKRLLKFLDEAEKTEDLLKVSADLDNVQTEIERLVGRMNYLQNKVDLSTVEIYLFEDNVVIRDIDKKELKIGERIKSQLAHSTNLLIVGLSSTIVLIIGNLPLIIVVACLGIAIFYIKKHFFKKRGKRGLFRKDDDLN